MKRFTKKTGFQLLRGMLERPVNDPLDRLLAEKNVLFCRVFRRASAGLVLLCSRARTLATPQPQADWQASAWPCFPSSDARVLGGGGSPEG